MMLRIKNFVLMVFLVGICQSVIAQNTSDSLDIYHEQMFVVLDEINQGQYNNFFNMIDFNQIIEFAFQDINPSVEFTQEDIRDFKMGTMEGAEKEVRSNYKLMFDTTHLVEYVNYTEEGDYYSILVRVLSEAGLNYFEFQLALDESGNVKIIDIYPFITGEFISQTMANSTKIILSENSVFSSIVSSLSGSEREYTENISKLGKIKDYIVFGNYQAARDLYESMPESVQNEKVFLLIMFRAADAFGDDYYISLIEKYEKNYPNDPSLPLISIDGLLLKGRFEESFKMIDQLDEAIGGDLYLDVLRGNIASIQQDTLSAIDYYQRAIKNDLYREEAYYLLIDLYVGAKDYSMAIKYLKRVEFIFGYEYLREDFSDPMFQNFITSSEFEEWINR